MRRTYTLYRKGIHSLLAEIKRLAPALEVSTRIGGNVALSSLIISTSRSRSAFENREAHLHDCPVANGNSALPLVCSTEEFLARPCVPCLSFRLNHLASKAFCHDFCEKCVSSSSNDCPTGLLEDIQQSFGSLESFLEQLAIFTSSSRRSGHTWIIYNSCTKKIVFMNLAGVEVPISLGLWPLAAVEMTERVLSEALVKSEKTVDITLLPWTRGARNSLAINFYPGHSVSSLVEARRTVAHDFFARLNWDFMYQQLSLAKAYYTSDGRNSAQTMWREEQQREASSMYLLQYRSENEPIVQKSGLYSSTHPSKTTTHVNEKVNDSCNNRDTDRAGDHASGHPEKPQTFKRANGVWEYLFNDGRQVFVYPDGKNVYKEKNLTTTVFGDGSKRFEYVNGTIITESNNIRVYKYPDGRTTEESIK